MGESDFSSTLLKIREVVATSDQNADEKRLALEDFLRKMEQVEIRSIRYTKNSEFSSLEVDNMKIIYQNGQITVVDDKVKEEERKELFDQSEKPNEMLEGEPEEKPKKPKKKRKKKEESSESSESSESEEEEKRKKRIKKKKKPVSLSPEPRKKKRNKQIERYSFERAESRQPHAGPRKVRPPRLNGEAIQPQRCRHWAKGSCTKGDMCIFAHTGQPGVVDLVGKSKLCRHFLMGDCTMGEKCAFSHDLRGFVPRRPCMYWEQGECSKGDECTFLHSLDRQGIANRDRSPARESRTARRDRY